MTTRLPDIEDRLSSKAWSRVTTSRTLWNQFCNEAQARQISFAQLLTYLVKGFVILVLAAAYPLGLIPQVYQVQGAAGLLAVQSILLMIGTPYLANLLSSSLQCSRMITVFSHLPATDRHMAWFIYKRQHWPLMVVFYLQICVYGFLAFSGDPGDGAWGWAPIVAAGQVVIYWGAATILLRYFPQKVLGWSVFRLLPFIVLASCWPSLQIPANAVSTILAILPSGWLNLIVLRAAEPNGLQYLWLLLPLAGWCWWGYSSLMDILNDYRVRQFYVRRGQEMEVELSSSPRLDAKIDDILSVESSRELAGLSAERNPAVSSRQRREQIRTRKFVESDDWSNDGWIEWLGYHCLNDRERLVIESLSSNCIAWSPGWWTFAVASVTAWLILTPLNVGNLIWFVEAFIAFAYLALGFWPAFHLRNCGGTYVSQVYGMPIGLDETFSAFMKVALLRICAGTVIWFPLIVFINMNRVMGMEISIAIGLMTIVLAVSISVWSAYFLFGIGAEFSAAERRFFWFIGLLVMSLVSIGGTIHATQAFQHNNFFDIVRQMGTGLSIVMTATSLNWFIFRTIYRNGAIDLVVFHPPYSQDQFASRELHEIQVGRKAEKRRRGLFWWSNRSSSSVESI